MIRFYRCSWCHKSFSLVDASHNEGNFVERCPYCESEDIVSLYKPRHTPRKDQEPETIVYEEGV